MPVYQGGGGGCTKETSVATLSLAPVVDTTISRVKVRCKNRGGGGGVPASKRVKLAAAESLSVDDLRKSLSDRRLSSNGGQAALVARLEKDRRAEGCCAWRGTVGELRAHLEDTCMREPMRCPNQVLALHPQPCTKTPKS